MLKHIFTLCLTIQLVVAQNIITGKITDATTKEPIKNTKIEIVLNDSIKKTIITDIEGNYNLNIKEKNTKSVKIKSTNYKTKTYSNLRLSNTTTVYNISLESNEKDVKLDDKIIDGEESTIITSTKNSGTTSGSGETFKSESRKKHRTSAPIYSTTTSGSSISTISYETGRTFGYSDYKLIGGGDSDVPISNSNAKSGLLSAGEISDFSKFNLWKKYLGAELKSNKEIVGIVHGKRITVEVTNENQIPIPFTKVKLYNGNNIIWEAYTDNTGKAELWTGKDTLTKNFEIEVNAKKTRQIKFWEDGINRITVNTKCFDDVQNLEIGFMVDATSSMSDEIDYLKKDVVDIISNSKKYIQGSVKVASVFYRDKGDEYLTRVADFKPIKDAEKFINVQNAGGGGDFPEAVEDGLEASINQLSWSEKNTTKILFMVLDAPPHMNDIALKSIEKNIQLAAQKGIRLVPLICSGSDKNLEYLMRTSALMTNGTYLFLTDHSGIGNAHTAPTTDKYDVYTLNQLMTNVIERFTKLVDCKPIELEDSLAVTEKFVDYLTKDDPNMQREIKEGNDSSDIDTISKRVENGIDMNVYPNPFISTTTVEFTDDVTGNLSIFDMNGKLIEVINWSANRRDLVDLSSYSVGVYFFIFHDGKNKIVKKVIKSM